MLFNNMFFPAPFPVRRNYFPLPEDNFSSTKNTIKTEKEIIELPDNKNNSRQKKDFPFGKIFSFLDLELDDLLILGILFFLYLEKCDDLLLYGALFLLLFDIEIDSFLKFL